MPDSARNAYASWRKKGDARKSSLPPPNPGSAQLNPKFKDKTPRELQDDLKELKLELIARGFNCEINLTFLHKIKI